MTRIDTPLAQPTADKPVEKTVGKASSKDGDSRHAAFRSLLKQIGENGGMTKDAASKDARVLSDGLKSPSQLRPRPATKEGKTGEPTAETDFAAVQSRPPSDSSEPALVWQAILGSGEQPEQPIVAVDINALVAARAPESDTQAPRDRPLATNDRQDRTIGLRLPSTPDLDLAPVDAGKTPVAKTETPFTALSSLLDRSSDAAAETDMVDVAPMKMSIVTRETHFEPVARLSPVQQIVSAIGDDIATSFVSSPGEVAEQPTEPSRHSAGPLKVLHVKLEPEDLGAVVLKMRLVDQSLELEVVASRQETADLLAKDKDMLAKALRSSGYTADIVAITTSTAPDGGQMTGDGRTGSQTPSGQGGAQAGGNRDSNNAAGGDGRPAGRPQSMEGATHEESGAGRSGGDLYL